MIQYLHFRILKFPLIDGLHPVNNLHLVGGLEHEWIMAYHSVGNFVIPTDNSYFSVETTNQPLIIPLIPLPICSMVLVVFTYLTGWFLFEHMLGFIFQHHGLHMGYTRGGELSTNRKWGAVHPSYEWRLHLLIHFITMVITHLRFVGSSPPSSLELQFN